jgi:hypothetical protein
MEVPFGGTLELVVFLAQHVFGKGERVKGERGPEVDLEGIRVGVKDGRAKLRWAQGSKLDIMADQFSFLLFQFPSEEYDIFHQEYVPE